MKEKSRKEHKRERDVMKEFRELQAETRRLGMNKPERVKRTKRRM